MNLKVYRCAWCNKHLMEPKGGRQPRSDKRFCSSAHRGKYNRWLKNLDKLSDRATRDVKEMAQYLEHPQAQMVAAGHMVALMELIKREAVANGLAVVE